MYGLSDLPRIDNLISNGLNLISVLLITLSLLGKGNRKNPDNGRVSVEGLFRVGEWKPASIKEAFELFPDSC